jgi:DNA-binding beta-propeller fold protein YncE
MTTRKKIGARTRSLVAIGLGALGWAAVVACNQTTIPTPIRSFDRPSDAALVCMQFNPNAFDPVSSPHGVFDVRPLADCEPVRAESLGITPSYALPVNYIAPIGPNPPFRPFPLALVTQSARGELALVDTAQAKLVDTDPFKPGFGFVPVGKLPEHVRATSDGCFAVTANTDSCNLSMVNVLAVVRQSLKSYFPTDMGSTATATGVDTLPLTVRASDGSLRELHARPSWIEVAPDGDGGALPSLTGPTGGTPGQCTPQAGTAHRVWVALPACQAVVKVRLEARQTDESTPGNPMPPEPTIEQAIKVTKSGAQVVTDLSTLDCPIECAGVPSDLGPPPTPPLDMGPTDAGSNLPTNQAWPSTLAIDVEGDVSGAGQAGRLVIGDGYGERVDIVPFDVKTATLGAARSVTLDPGANGLQSPGVRVVRVGRRSEAGKFLYAVARDGTVRVVDLDREAECETNPDPRWNENGLNLQQASTPDPSNQLPASPQPQARALGCFPLGAPGTPRRAPLATSPGISLTPGQVPVDVAFVHLDAPPGDPTLTTAPPAASPGLMVGDFAWIISSDGRGTVVNIYDACPAPNQQAESNTTGPYPNGACSLANVQQSLADTVLHFGQPQPMLLDRVSHRIRGGHDRFAKPLTESDATGMARVPDHLNPCSVAVPPTSPGVPDGGVDGGSGCNGSSALPSMFNEPVPQVLLAPGVSQQRVVRFVDPDKARNETWVMTWEGVVPGSDRALGQPTIVAKPPKPGESSPPKPTDQLYDAYLTDPGGAWCARGIRACDKLILRGCTVDSECDQAAGFTCVRDPGAFADVTQGMCLPTDPTKDGRAKTADEWPNVCGKLLRGQRKYRILNAQQGVPPPTATGGTTDVLHVAEIYEPEYFEERLVKTSPPSDVCATQDDCKNITVTQAVGGMQSPTSCMPDVDGVNRCVVICKNDSDCGADFQCARSQIGDNRCMRAPIDFVTWGQPNDQDMTTAHCMPEAQQYEVHIGNAFNVQGTASGFVSSEVVDTAHNNECIVPPVSSEYVRLRQWRIPLTTPNQCTGAPLDSMDPATGTNVCSLEMGNRIVHFENPLFNIALQLPEVNGTPLIPPDGTAVSMAVTAGGAPLIALLGVDVEAQQPRSVVVGPDSQTVYVVDEGKASTASGLRGQLLRLFTPTQSVDTTFVVR